MRIDVLTLFPKMFESPFAESIVARARAAGKLDLVFHDLRGWAGDRHRTVVTLNIDSFHALCGATDRSDGL